ncbi:MAG: hypothetical protein GY775_16800 [Candidatus Scalindua sp.]|nr:hypothetical protein [Candidatus Scalindua sp.]
MAIKLGLIGLPNTGKSFSRKTIKNGEEVFIIAPSHKAMHITDSKGIPLKKLSEDKKTGNWLINKNLTLLPKILEYIDKDRPEIKTIILPDFTHFISAVIADKKFISRKAGGEAFQRFWELAGDALNNFIISIDTLREDLIVVTEYHAEYSEVEEMYKIFVPGGKMLEEKFKLDSYYDFMLYTHVKQQDTGEVENYNFVTRRWDKYNARSSELFKETLIPNDLELVLSKMREYLGI